MNIVASIVNKDNIKTKIILDLKNDRYSYESLLLGALSSHALNKEKNKNKPKFEGLELMDIFTHLVSEIFEVKHELNQNNINYEKLLDEIGDCAALLTGLVAYIIQHKDDSLK